jgi:hypothetical protein
VECNGVAEDMEYWQTLVNVVANIQVSKMANFLTSRAAVSFLTF